MRGYVVEINHGHISKHFGGILLAPQQGKIRYFSFASLGIEIFFASRFRNKTIALFTRFYASQGYFNYRICGIFWMFRAVAISESLYPVYLTEPPGIAFVQTPG